MTSPRGPKRESGDQIKPSIGEGTGVRHCAQQFVDFSSAGEVH